MMKMRRILENIQDILEREEEEGTRAGTNTKGLGGKFCNVLVILTMYLQSAHNPHNVLAIIAMSSQNK